MEEDAPHPPEDPPTYINTIITDSGGDPSAVGQDNATATMVAMARRIIELREENRGLRNQNARGSAEIGRLKLELSLSKEKICHLESEVSGYVQELARKISLEETDNRGRSPRGKKRTFSETEYVCVLHLMRIDGI